MLSKNVRNRVFRFLTVLFAALGVFTVGAHATPLTTYTFQLTFTSPTMGDSGTGILVIQAPATLAAFTPYTVTSFTAEIGGDEFSSSDSTTISAHPLTFTFQTVGSNPTVRDLTLSEMDVAGGAYSSTLGYFFTPKNGVRSASGTIAMTLIPNVAPAPEPSSIALLGTGMLAGAGGLYRRIRLQRS